MQIIPKTLKGYIQSISGLFITKENPTGMTPKEIYVLSAFVFFIKSEGIIEVNNKIKKQVEAALDLKPQVVTNYVKKFRDKKILDSNNKLHKLLYTGEITILCPKPH